MKTERRTTTGEARYSDMGTTFESADDPVPPDEDGEWKMTGCVIGPMCSSVCILYWFWERKYVG